LKAIAITLTLCLSAMLAGFARAETLLLPPRGDNVVGLDRTVRIRAEDTLLDVARRYDYGYAEIKLANPGVDPWLPGKGTKVVLPGTHILPDAPHEGIVINIPEMRLYYYPAPRWGRAPSAVVTYPIGIGKQGWLAPEVLTRVVEKQRHPVWVVPDSIRQEQAAQGKWMPVSIPAGKGNPLGDFALRLGMGQYLIHGTNKKYGVGMRVSHGCFRLNPADIRTLFQSVPVGTPVRIVNQPYKAGVLDGRVYLEAYPPLAELRHATPLRDMVWKVVRATEEGAYDIDWDKAQRVAQMQQGIPVEIGVRRPERRR
jgi:L,D-transpeptidase ErfK/SrfK